MQSASYLSLREKYMIEVTYEKKFLKFNLPDTNVESLITFLRKANKVSQSESVYLYLQPGNKLINMMSKVSQLAKQSEEVNAKMMFGKQVDKGQKTEEDLNVDRHPMIAGKNVLRLKMVVYETF